MFLRLFSITVIILIVQCESKSGDYYNNYYDNTSHSNNRQYDEVANSIEPNQIDTNPDFNKSNTESFNIEETENSTDFQERNNSTEVVSENFTIINSTTKSEATFTDNKTIADISTTHFQERTKSIDVSESSTVIAVINSTEAEATTFTNNETITITSTTADFKSTTQPNLNLSTDSSLNYKTTESITPEPPNNKIALFSFNTNYLYLFLLVFPVAGIICGIYHFCKRSKRRKSTESNITMRHRTKRNSTPSWVFSEPDYIDEEVETLREEKE